MDVKIQKAFDGVIAASPPGQTSDTQDAVMKQRFSVSITLALAGKTGGEKKIVSLATSYEKAADLVIAAPPADKLKVMKKEFRAVTDAA